MCTENPKSYTFPKLAKIGELWACCYKRIARTLLRILQDIFKKVPYKAHVLGRRGRRGTCIYIYIYIRMDTCTQNFIPASTRKFGRVLPSGPWALGAQRAVGFGLEALGLEAMRCPSLGFPTLGIREHAVAQRQACARIRDWNLTYHVLLLIVENLHDPRIQESMNLAVDELGWAPPGNSDPRDNGNDIRTPMHSYGTTIALWGLHLTDNCTRVLASKLA